MKKKYFFVIVAIIVIISGAVWLQKEAASNKILTVEEYAAVRDKFVGIVKNEDPRMALEVLREEMKRDPILLRSCHPLVHEIGHAAYQKYNDFGTTMEYASEMCNSGYMHGVIESYLSASTDVSETMKTACAPYPQGKMRSWHCYHGMGHAMMYYTDNDLPKSVESCKKYEYLFGRDACVNGVFMENFNTNQKTHLSKYLKEDDALYPCEEQDLSDKNNCYTYAPSYYLGLHAGDYDGMLAVCENAPAAFQGACAIGAGGVTIQENMNNPELVEKICMRGDLALASDCIKGMTENTILYTSSLAPAEELCQKLSLQNRETCQTVIESYRYLF